ncbi:hypothetical protein M8C21_017822 [Ambrosia artemisiifolia]|uniref:RanBP2-type domain-containing protein n=1 Tax=Ambrosia artemisiifolia TaxID=4212 RepID=A0AAD5C5W8_AMBAR|nr:hypothetical protein M8C21_017822 [Ambrosia artemisiifolia]
MSATIAVTRFLSLFESTTTTTNLHPFRTVQFPTKPLSSPTLRLHRRYSSSYASVITDETTTLTVSQQQYPWPEWVTFVDRLKSKGYIRQEAATENDVSVYKDMTVLKEACLSFGRDRFDLFRSLSMQDIQTLVEKGCPNINRKTVNSGKRLRAHLQLDEGDVCGICVFRESCDRAYVTLKDNESDARTVDIVRVLLNYALDPAVDSDKKTSGAEVVEASAKKLLVELTKLSDTKVDPELQKPVVTVGRKAQSSKVMERDSSRNVEMKRGDWLCPRCNFLNFFRNKKCRECNEDGPKKPGGDAVEMKKGDWNCPQCNFMNFSRNIRCLKCKTEGPKRVGINDVEMKKGDWNCPQCQFMNFASNTKCDFLNYAGNVVCRKCNCERLEDAEAKYQEQMWRKP